MKNLAIVSIDMRCFIAGSGWHRAEVHGRWGGPSKTSSICFPPLDARSYQLEIEVIDAISPQLLDSLQLRFNGHEVLATCADSAKGLRERISAFWRSAVFMQRAPRYPVLVQGLIDESVIAPSGQYNLLEIISPHVNRPSTRGAHDDRRLSICVSKTELRTRTP